ncbi:MAG: AbrB/MazE/SpoVT family DNA-binding domain-containing protein [Ruminococcaceae bacterium]|nr:AbrB/MazE/SpoVT family DNA-binding domain-containing protein [Oscillospiraceae bacterium]
MPRGKHLLGLPKGKYIFGTVKVGEKGQIVIPKEARELFSIKAGDSLLVLGDISNGLIISTPELVNDMAANLFRRVENSEKNENTEEKE